MNRIDTIYILFYFILGASIGSFLNVVVWRLPRVEISMDAPWWKQIYLVMRGLAVPGSHCPQCNHPLAANDNIPVFGWVLLRGKCRYCAARISARYPIVEAATGLMFVLFYVLFFIYHVGPCPAALTYYYDKWEEKHLLLLNLKDHWPIFWLYLFAASCLLAASLIDAEMFIIPIEIPWLMALVGVIVHTFIDRPTMPGALNSTGAYSAMSAGGGIGLVISFLLWKWEWIPTSFPEGEPLLEADRAVLLEEAAGKTKGVNPQIPEQLPPDYSRGQIRLEMSKEMLFLLPPLILAGLSAFLFIRMPSVRQFWMNLNGSFHLTGFLGALLGGLVGAFAVWITRILGTLGFGRVAMGLGDVHLMFGVGAIIGAGASTVTFFIAPFFGLALAFYFLISRSRRELPYGPYLSAAAVFVMFLYCPIAEHLAPGLNALLTMLRDLI